MTRFRPMLAIFMLVVIAFASAFGPHTAAQDPEFVDLQIENASTVMSGAATPAATPDTSASATPGATPAVGNELTGFLVGDPDAPVTLQIYGDYQCPYCRAFFSEIEPQIIEEYVQTGLVRLELLDMTVVGVPSLGAMTDDTLESVQAAEAAMCAAEQDSYLEYRHTLYSGEAQPNSGAFSDDNLKAFAEEIGLDTARFDECLESGRYESAVIAFVNQAVGRGVTGTPTLSINGGTPFFPPDNGFEGISEMLDEALAS